MALTLWSETDPARWLEALDAYGARINRRATSRLPELDAWYRDELPALLHARPEPYVTLEELVDVTSWKMKRGVYRARNLQLVKSNPAAEVVACSKRAFLRLPDLRKPISDLAKLAGVGPATASAVLAAYRPEGFPFFDEEVALQVPDLGKVAFTASYYFRYAEALRARAQELSTRGPLTWTAHGVAQALWAVAPGS